MPRLALFLPSFFLGLALVAPGAVAGTRAEKVDCPVAVTAFSGEALERQGTLSLDVIQALPGVTGGGTASGGGAANVNIRGLRNNSMLYLSNVARARGMPGLDPTAIERIDVLRGPQGTLFCATQDNASWRAADAARPGELVFPTYGFVVPYVTFNDTSVRVPVGRPFGVFDGQFVTGHDWMRDVHAPFSLLCRSDEGAPVDLGIGDRLAFRVPGDQLKLEGVLNRDFMIDPHCFKLPDAAGYACESGAGSDPRLTWDALAKVQASGDLLDLEWASCEEFYPESGAQARGCQPGPKRFPEKAVRFGDRLSATLTDPFGRSTIDGATILWGPLPPTPFFDPGYRSGDEKGPSLGRTDADGHYTVTAGDLRGSAVEVSVAKGCAQHTTVAVSEPATPPPPPVPRPEPPEGSRICGPDVTDKVLDIMGLMKRKWDAWSEAERSTHCTKIINPLTALGAWDMNPFSPSSYTDLRVAPNYCAVPDWPCGSTVEFLGYCLPSQVVNYVQWGGMTTLCNIEATGIFVHVSRDTVNSLLSTAKNILTLDWGNVRNPVESKNYEGQFAMSALGDAYMHDADDPAFARRVMKRLIDHYAREANATWWQMDGTDCAVACEETAGADFIKGKFDTLGWGFQWGDSSFSLKQEQIEQELREMQQRKNGGR